MFARWHVNMTTYSIYAGYLPEELKHYTERELYALPFTILKRLLPAGLSFWHLYHKHHEDQQHTLDLKKQASFDKACFHSAEIDAQLLKADKGTLLPKQLERRAVLEKNGHVEDGQNVTYRNLPRDKDKLKQTRLEAAEARDRMPEMIRKSDLTNSAFLVLDCIRRRKRFI